MRKLWSAFLFCLPLFAQESVELNPVKNFPAYIENGTQFRACFSDGDFANALSSGEVAESEDSIGLNSYCCIEGEAQSEERFFEVKEGEFSVYVTEKAWITKNNDKRPFFIFSKTSRHLKALKKDIHFINKKSDSLVKSVASINCSPGLFNRADFGMNDVKNQFGEFFSVGRSHSRKTASARD